MTLCQGAGKPLFFSLFLLFVSAYLLSTSTLVYSEPREAAKSMTQETRAGLGLMQAVQVTLYQQPEVLIQQQEVEISRGNLRMEAGVFDPNLTSSFLYQTNEYAPTYWQNELYGIGDRNYTTTGSSVGLETKSRYGFSFGPSVGVTRSHGITDYMMPTSYNQAIVAFSVNVPLLKGMGKEAADADEMAAMEELEASTLDLEQTLSQSVMNTTQAYWNYLAALRQFEVFQEMEKDAGQTLDAIRHLVKGDERPASDLDPFEANLAQKTSQRINSEQTLFEAKQNLGLAMGLAYGAIDNLPLPTDVFPDTESVRPASNNMNPDALFQEALRNRPDFLALKKRESAANIILVAAKNNVLPQLDINAGVGYAGLENGGEVSDYVRSLGKNVTGANYQAGIQFSYPFGNNQAEGLVVQRRSDLQKVVIRSRDLARKINSGILVAVQAMWRTLRELRETRNSIAHYRKAVSSEQIKFSMGMASVMDVINMQDRLRDVRLSEVSQMNRFADAVVQLGFETGTLVMAEGDTYRIEMKNLTSPWSKKGSGP